jgi:hypothetical protein
MPPEQMRQAISSFLLAAAPIPVSISVSSPKSPSYIAYKLRSDHPRATRYMMNGSLKSCHIYMEAAGVVFPWRSAWSSRLSRAQAAAAAAGSVLWIHIVAVAVAVAVAVNASTMSGRPRELLWRRRRHA